MDKLQSDLAFAIANVLPIDGKLNDQYDVGRFRTADFIAQGIADLFASDQSFDRLAFLKACHVRP